MGAVLPELFPTNVRYTGSADLVQRVVDPRRRARADRRRRALGRLAAAARGSSGSTSRRWAVLTFIALLLAPETKDVDYDANLGVGATGSL